MGSVLASNKDIVIMIYIGTLVRQMDEADDLGSGDEDSRKRETQARTWLLLAQARPAPCTPVASRWSVVGFSQLSCGRALLYRLR